MYSQEHLPRQDFQGLQVDQEDPVDLFLLSHLLHLVLLVHLVVLMHLLVQFLLSNLADLEDHALLVHQLAQSDLVHQVHLLLHGLPLLLHDQARQLAHHRQGDQVYQALHVNPVTQRNLLADKLTKAISCRTYTTIIYLYNTCHKHLSRILEPGAGFTQQFILPSGHQILVLQLDQLLQVDQVIQGLQGGQVLLVNHFLLVVLLLLFRQTNHVNLEVLGLHVHHPLQGVLLDQAIPGKITGTLIMV